MKSPRVLSIQSRVVSGYVGNNIASICLLVNGFDLSTIDTVTFSNHTGYGKWEGFKLTREQFQAFVSGLRENKLDYFSHILTGFISSSELLYEVYHFIKQEKEKNEILFYVCDPVIGDNGKCYVPESLIPIYRSCLLSLADVIVPNQYEAQWLSEISSLESMDDIMKCVKILHSKGPRIVIISSVANFLSNDENLLCFSSEIDKNEHTIKCWKIKKLSYTFVGTGDAFSALLTASLRKFDYNVEKAVYWTLCAMHHLIQKTAQKVQLLCHLTHLHPSFRHELSIEECIDRISLSHENYENEEITQIEI